MTLNAAEWDQSECPDRMIQALCGAGLHYNSVALHEFACYAVEGALRLFAGRVVPLGAARDAIAAKRAWLVGDATDAELDAAGLAAKSAASDAGWVAVGLRHGGMWTDDPERAAKHESFTVIARAAACAADVKYPYGVASSAASHARDAAYWIAYAATPRCFGDSRKEAGHAAWVAASAWQARLLRGLVGNPVRRAGWGEQTSTRTTETNRDAKLLQMYLSELARRTGRTRR